MSLRRDRIRTAAASTVAVGLVVGAPFWAAAGPSPQPLVLGASGTNGVSVVQAGGQSCASGGSGNHRDVSVSSPLPANNPVISAVLPGTMTGLFVMSHDGDEPVDTPISGIAARAFLLGTDSVVTLTNERGSVMLRLSAGTCAAPTLAFNGFTVSGTGTWTVDQNGTTGSYHPTPPAGTTGSGTFTLTAGVRPNVDNPWTLQLNGGVSVPQPGLQVVATKAAWANLGDYLNRIVTVSYQVTNTGPGDSFAPVLTGAAALTPGVTVIGPVPQSLPDLPHGQSVLAKVRYKLALPAPCALLILSCAFDTRVSVSMPDVLDKADLTPPSAVTHVKFPLGPLPL